TVPRPAPLSPPPPIAGPCNADWNSATPDAASPAASVPRPSRSPAHHHANQTRSPHRAPPSGSRVNRAATRRPLATHPSRTLG
ncbi:MAG: hypothetical protein ACKO3P_16990, partial [Planctomycetaceae bacterium]